MKPNETSARVRPLPEPNAASARAARARQNSLTKPPGSLGRLEDLAVQIAAWQAEPLPRARPAAALLFAADHPVTRHGVSPYPSEVTRAMLANFSSGGAAASVLAGEQRLPLVVVDVGVSDIAKTDRRSGASIRCDPVARDPSGDIRVEDAMSLETFERCLEAGRNTVASLGDIRVLLLGEMGIGNTTPAAAVCAALLGGDPGEFAGEGTGTRGAALENKRQVVRDAVQRLRGESEPRAILRRAGGRELCALFGAMCAALEKRVIVLVDGFIVTAVSLALCREWPGSAAGLVFAHRSGEQAHQRVLEHLGAEPLLDLRLRLGEGSGALLAFSLLEHACSLHEKMATFESAGVPDRKDAP